MKTQNYLRDQYVVNQSNYPNTVINAVAMYTSFGSDIGDNSDKKFK